MDDIYFINYKYLLKTNEIIKKQSFEIEGMYYTGKKAPDVKPLKKLLKYADNYSCYVDDLLCVAAFYLKNIIILQGFIDGNHRTAMVMVSVFLCKNGLSDKTEIPPKSASKRFRSKMSTLIDNNYQKHESFNVDYICKLEDNDVDNECFLYCLEFIENNML